MGIGLALAGGGLKGIAYIGALKALEELKIEIDYLSGTSSGSIFATLYAMGLTIDEIKKSSLEYYKVLTSIRKAPLLKAGFSYMTTGIAKIEGLIPGELVQNLVTDIAKEKNVSNMNDIKMPFAVATVDTISTKECIFLSQRLNLKEEDVDYIYDAPIGTAVRSSMSFPGIFTPCSYKGYNFIDGGTKDNLPVRILKNMGAKRTLALSFKIDEYEPHKDILAVLLRAVDIFSLKDVREAQRISDLAIEIDARGTSLLEIDDIDKVISTGYDAIMEQKENILNLLSY